MRKQHSNKKRIKQTNTKSSKKEKKKQHRRYGSQQRVGQVTCAREEKMHFTLVFFSIFTTMFDYS